MASELATTGGGYTPEQVDLLKRTICKGASNDEFALFLHQCQRTGLDPFARQCHAVKRWDASQQREVMAIQTGIDGFRLIAERTGKYAGNDDPVYDTEDAPHPNKATVTVWKMVAGQRVAFSRSARWKEFVQKKKDGTVTKFWANMPYLMLGKVAEALALRAAFPQELSGLYTSDEMGQATNDDDHHAEPAHVERPALPPAKPATTGPEFPPQTRVGDPTAKERAAVLMMLTKVQSKAEARQVWQAEVNPRIKAGKLTNGDADTLHKAVAAHIANLPETLDREPGDEEPDDAAA